MNNRFLKALCAGLATVVLASPAAVAGLSIEMTNTITVTTTSAVVRLKVVTNDEAAAQGWLYWGLTNNGNNATWPTTNAVGAVITGSVYTVSLSGLTAGTTYWATAYATNGATNAWATWQTNFNTLATYAPTSILVSAYPSGVLRAPANFFGANGMATSNDLAATTNALRILLQSLIQSGDLSATNYSDAVTNALRIWTESRVGTATQTIAAATISGTITNPVNSSNVKEGGTNILQTAINAADDAATFNAELTNHEAQVGSAAHSAMVTNGATFNAGGATNLNATELRTGTVPPARLSGITSNQIDATTDAAYSGTSTSDVQAIVNDMAGTGTYHYATSAGTAATATSLVGVVTGSILTNASAFDTAGAAAAITNGCASGTNLSGSVFVNGRITSVGTAFTGAGTTAVQAAVAPVGYLLPESTSTLATVTQLNTATNSAVTAATNLVQTVGYLQSTNTPTAGQMLYASGTTKSNLYFGAAPTGGSSFNQTNATMYGWLSLSNLVFTSASGTYTNTITFNGTGMVSTITP